MSREGAQAAGPPAPSTVTMSRLAKVASPFSEKQMPSGLPAGTPAGGARSSTKPSTSSGGMGGASLPDDAPSEKSRPNWPFVSGVWPPFTNVLPCTYTFDGKGS